MKHTWKLIGNMVSLGSHNLRRTRVKTTLFQCEKCKVWQGRSEVGTTTLKDPLKDCSEKEN